MTGGIVAPPLDFDDGRQANGLTPFEQVRLDVAAKIAAGMCANPQNYSSGTWAADTAYESVRLADNMLRLVITGGC